MIQVPLRALMAMIPAFVLTILLFLGGNALLRVYTDSTAYPAYMETLDLSEGSVDSTPTADTPLAKTVADMESMDTFTIIGSVAWDRPLPLDGQRYYEVEIKTDQGYTTFLARINKDASERLETGGRRLPIGRWLPLEAEDPDGVLDRSYNLDIKDHYADMEGDFGKILTKSQFHARHPGFTFLEVFNSFLLLALWFAFLRLYKKKGWF